jgi:hypothetical protein
MVIRGLLVATSRHVAALALGGAILWQVAERAVPRECEAVVHVTEAGVDVAIDDSTYRFEAWRGTPIVCALRPGRHTVCMSRDGQVLYEEVFTLRPGENVILTAWDRGRSGDIQAAARADRTRQLAGGSS